MCPASSISHLLDTAFTQETEGTDPLALVCTYRTITFWRGL